MTSQSVTCHPAEVTFPLLLQQSCSIRFSDPGGTQGWVTYWLITHRDGVAISCRFHDMRFVENEHVVQPFLSVSRVPQTRMYVVSCGSKLNYSVPVSGVEYCDDRLSVCLSASISPETNVRSLPYFCARYPCPWLRRSLEALRYVMYFRFMDDVIFEHTDQQ